MKKDQEYVNYGIPLRETTYALLESQEEESGEKDQNGYFKKQW